MEKTEKNYGDRKAEGISDSQHSGSDKWNPNRPAQFTQEEFLEHIHEIEKGPFTPLDIANREFEEWKVEFLRNQL